MRLHIGGGRFLIVAIGGPFVALNLAELVRSFVTGDPLSIVTDHVAMAITGVLAGVLAGVDGAAALATGFGILWGLPVIAVLVAHLSGGGNLRTPLLLIAYGATAVIADLIASPLYPRRKARAAKRVVARMMESSNGEMPDLGEHDQEGSPR
jgi:hypothetical protein